MGDVVSIHRDQYATDEEVQALLDSLDNLIALLKQQ